MEGPSAMQPFALLVQPNHPSAPEHSLVKIMTKRTMPYQRLDARQWSIQNGYGDDPNTVNPSRSTLGKKMSTNGAASSTWRSF
mmetsp:Transcript_21435/g.31486  ORF Transcript_21435/g.31486 Transcript_21435/m.31486 type:complete len:83 (+) Transcript_21435:80-328(+)